MVRKERLELSRLARSLGIAEPNSSASTNSVTYIIVQVSLARGSLNFRYKKTS